MKELLEITQAWNDQCSRGGRAALATVVQVDGSSYRRPGARMLILPNGETVGSVSGGCLEADVAARACAVMDSGAPELATYDTRRDDDVIFGVGLGCQGVIQILIERLSEADDASLNRSQAMLAVGQPGILATVYRTRGDTGVTVGDRLLLRADGQWQGEASLFSAVRRALQAQRSGSCAIKLGVGSADVFFDYVRPALPLVIFGAGHDAQPLARLAKEMGWHVSIVDSRPLFATIERFPTADAVCIAPRECLPTEVTLNSETMVVLMTHSYLQDLALLRELLPSPVRYLGVLGPQRRTQRLLTDLEEAGQTITHEQQSRLYGPVGLDIGAETPEQIALAIIGEIQAITSGHNGGFLRDHDGPISGDAMSDPPSARSSRATRSSCAVSG